MVALKMSPKMKKYLSWKQWMFFWYRHYKAMFFCGFLVVFSIGGYFWYQNLHQYQWSEERKKLFLEENFKETQFKERDFEAVVNRLKNRADSHKSSPVLSRDIFSGKSLK